MSQVVQSVLALPSGQSAHVVKGLLAHTSYYFTNLAHKNNISGLRGLRKTTSILFLNFSVAFEIS